MGIGLRGTSRGEQISDPVSDPVVDPWLAVLGVDGAVSVGMLGMAGGGHPARLWLDVPGGG